MNTKTIDEQQAELDNWFEYHAPVADQSYRYSAIRQAGKTMAEELLAQCPQSADLTTAIRCIRQAVFWANASIACGGK